MPLQPRKVKYRKSFRGRMKGISTAGSQLEFGDFGLKSLGRGWLKAEQIEAARRVITRITKRGARIWIRIFPDKPFTKKPAGAPMGSGKGDVEGYVAVVLPGRIIFEVGGVEEEVAKEALRQAASKLPFTTKIVSKA